MKEFLYIMMIMAVSFVVTCMSTESYKALKGPKQNKFNQKSEKK